MTPRAVVLAWVDSFNRGDAAAPGAMDAEDATNHQVANEPITGRPAIQQMFEREFAVAKMTCSV